MATLWALAAVYPHRHEGKPRPCDECGTMCARQFRVDGIWVCAACATMEYEQVTPQQKQYRRKVTVDLGDYAEQFYKYTDKHFAGDKSHALRCAVVQLMKRPPQQKALKESEAKKGRPK